MSISYAEIPADNLEPIFATEFDGSNASKGGPMPWKNLIIGQPLASKMATNGTLAKVTSDEQADADYGYGSQLALMIHAFRKNSKTAELWVLPIADDNSSAAATGTLTFAVADSTNGLAANGTIRLMIGGQSCAVNVAAGDKANDVAAKVAAAIGAVGTVSAPNTKNYPVTASASSAVVTLTAKNKGTCGNGIDVRWNYYQGEKLPEGLTITKTALANGGSDPSYEDAAVKATCAGSWFKTVILGSEENANVAYIKEMLDELWPATVQKDGVLFFSLNGSSTESAFTTRGEALDSRAIVLAALPKSPTPGFVKAAAFVGCIAPKALNDPANPLSNYAVAGVVAPAPEDREGFDGNNALLKSGCATMKCADDGTVYLDRIVTTYKHNAAGAVDTAYRQLETIFTLSYLRWDWNNYMASKYQHAKLADDGNNFGAGQVVMTPSLGRAELLGRYKVWEEKGLVQNYKDFAENLVVQLDPDDQYAMQFLIPAHLIKQFFISKTKIQFD